MKYIDRFETKYVDVYRVLIVTVVFLTILAALAGLTYWIGVKASAEEHRSEEYFKTPSWSSIRMDVLPLVDNLETDRGDYKENGGSKSKTTDESGKQESIFVDPRILEVSNNLSKQFERNEEGVKQFREMLPRRVLQEWLVNDSGISLRWKERFLDDVVLYSRELGEDGRINRIGSIEERAKMLISALEKYVDRYIESIEIATRAASTMNKEERDRQEEVNTTLLYILPICAYILLSLIALVVLIRVEVHLRTIANNSSSSGS